MAAAVEEDSLCDLKKKEVDMDNSSGAVHNTRFKSHN